MVSTQAAHVNCGRLGGGVKPPSIWTLNFCKPCERNISPATTRSNRKKKSLYGPSSRFINAFLERGRQDNSSRRSSLTSRATLQLSEFTNSFRTKSFANDR